MLIDDPNEVMRFTGDMATSDGLYLHIRSLTAAARTSAEFKVAVAPPAIAAGYAGCPLTPAAQARALPPVRRDDKENKEDKEG